MYFNGRNVKNKFFIKNNIKIYIYISQQFFLHTFIIYTYLFHKVEDKV